MVWRKRGVGGWETGGKQAGQQLRTFDQRMEPGTAVGTRQDVPAR